MGNLLKKFIYERSHPFSEHERGFCGQFENFRKIHLNEYTIN